MNRYYFKPINPAIVLGDGTKLPVQGSKSHYCYPRNDHAEYTEVEVGFPTSRPHSEMLVYAEDQDDPTNCIYPYVPVKIVRDFIDMHGGIKKGKMP